MKRTTVLDLSKFRFFKDVRENPSLIAFFILFIFSFFIGCVFYKNGNFERLGKIVFDLYYTNQVSKGISFNLFFSFLIHFSFLFISYLFGTSVIGVAFIPATVVIRAFASALFLCYIYTNFGFQAITYNLLIFIPSSIVSILALLVGSVTSIKLSYNLGMLLFGEQKIYGREVNKKFFIVFLVLVLLMFLAATINSLLCSAFLKYFSLG